MNRAAASCFAPILAFGEILWDLIEGNEYIGGAPFNVAAHSVRCGLTAYLFSRVGSDDRGKRARAELLRLGVLDDWLQVDLVRPTGWVEATIDVSGQPSYRIGMDVAWDAIEPPTTTELDMLRSAGFRALVCGTLAQRSASSRAALASLRGALPNVPVFYDVNLRLPHTTIETVRATLPGVNILKLNDEEAEILAKELLGSRCSMTTFYPRLNAEFGVDLVITTKGAQGCRIAWGKRIVDVAGVPIQVNNTVGAGDAFAAAFLSSWLRGLDPTECARRANILGSWVASQPEAVPDYRTDLLNWMRA